MSSLPFTSWGLALDGDVQIEAGSSHDDDVSSAVTHTAAAPHTEKPPVRTQSTAAAPQSKARFARVAQSDTTPRLEDWERAAVEVYRETRRYRGATPSRQGSGVPPDDSALPRLAAFMATAFPQLLERQTPAAPSAHEQLRSTPLLLQYFLQVGYPARAHGASATPAAALIATAAQTVSWFAAATTEGDAQRAEACAAPVHCRFPADLLPDVVQQTVVAHRMRPSTAASWLLRVFVGLLGPEEAREYRAHNAVLHGRGQPAAPPDPTVPVTVCVQGLRQWAVVLTRAVYQLQAGGHVAPSKKAAAAPTSGDDDSDPGSHADKGSDWHFISLVVLRPTVMLLLRGCLRDAHGDSVQTSSVRAAEADTEVLLPPTPATRVVVDGLARLALTLCQHAEFPSRASADAGVGGADEQHDLARKHWVAYTQLAVQQLPRLPPHYSYLVPILDHVLSF